MYRIIIIVLVIIVLAYEFFLFPYVSKNLNKKNMLNDGNILIHNNDNDEITLFFPGNAMSIYSIEPFLHTKNYLLVTYRSKKNDGFFYGFGSTKIAIDNGYSAYMYAINNYKKVKVVTFSIGNGVFAEVLKKAAIKEKLEKLDSVVSLGGLPDLSILLNDYFGIFSHLFSLLYNNLETTKIFLQHLHCPYKIIHGKQDTIIPFKLALQMFHTLKLGGKDVNIVLLPNNGHNDINLLDYL
jgi:hypothetical protein